MLPTLPTLLRSVSALAHTEHTMRAWREVIVSRALLRLRGSLVREHWLAAARGNVAVAFGRELDAEDVLRLAGIEPTERPIPIETKVRALNVVDTFLAMVRAGANPMPHKPFFLHPYAPTATREIVRRIEDAIAAELAANEPALEDDPIEAMVAIWNDVARRRNLTTCRAVNEKRRRALRRAYKEQLGQNLLLWRRCCEKVGTCPWATSRRVTIDHLLYVKTLDRRIDEAMARLDPTMLPRIVIEETMRFLRELETRRVALSILSTEGSAWGTIDLADPDARLFERLKLVARFEIRDEDAIRYIRSLCEEANRP